jgi:hypothetical protein
MGVTNVGFQRYRRLWRGDIHAPYGENDIIEQEMMEEVRSSRMFGLVRPRCSAHHVNDCAIVDPNVRSHLYRKAAILPRSRKYSPGAVHGHKVGNCLFVSPTCMIGGCHRCRDQVKILQEKCNFLNQASGSRCGNELRDGRICTLLSDSNC